MTIETTIALDEDQHAFLIKKVEEGSYATLDAAIAAAIEEMRLAAAPLDPALIVEVKRRLETPEADFLPWDGKALMDEVRGSLLENESPEK